MQPWAPVLRRKLNYVLLDYGGSEVIIFSSIIFIQQIFIKHLLHASLALGTKI